MKFQRIEANNTITQYILENGCVYVRHGMTAQSFEVNGIEFERSYMSPSIVQATAQAV